MSNKIKIKLDTQEKVQKFVQITRAFVSDIDVITNSMCIDGKSLIGVFAINPTNEVYAKIISDNVEEIRKFDAVMEEFQ